MVVQLFSQSLAGYGTTLYTAGVANYLEVFHLTMI